MKDPRYPFALDEGTEIGGYLIDKVLGAGGFGITYRGYNDITHKQVAIKEFYIREISNRDGATVVVDQDVERGTYEYALKKFQEEAQSVVTRFAHPYIIRGENFLRAHNTCYLIMEYIEGSNLDDWLNARKTAPSEADIRPFFEKLFDAVDYVHQHNMMHRDLTPRNIMVRLNGDPVLIDFGAAGLGIDLGRSSKIVAQLRYAPPEQSDETASGVHGRYTDVFSLAGVLFRTVTTKTPMAPTSRLTRMSQHRGDGPVDPQAPVATLVANRADYSDAFLAGIDRGLTLDERLRPQSIGEFRRALGWARPGDVGEAETDTSDAVTAIMAPVTRPTAPPPPPPPVGHTKTADTDVTRAITGSRPPQPPRQSGVAGPTAMLETAIPSMAPAPAHEGAKPNSRRRVVTPGRIAAILVVVLAGAGWSQRAGLQSWIGDITAPSVVSPYHFQARLDDHTIALSGYVPTAESRAAILAKIGAALPTATIDDHLALGRGAPANMTAAIDMFVRHLPDMTSGSLDLLDASVTIAASAAAPAAYAPLKSDFSTLTSESKGSLKLVPATVSPYVFALATSGSETAPLATLTGYLPDDAARKVIATTLTSALPGVHIDDRTQTASGAPFDLAAVVQFLGPRLTDLDHANLTLGDGGFRLEGTPRDPALMAKAAAPVDPVAVPGHVPVTLAIAPMTVSPYVFKAATAEGTLTLTGFVPDAATRQQAVAAHSPDMKVVDRLQIADGAPGNDAEAIRFAITEAQMLETGSVTITDVTIDIAGVIRRVADVTDLKTEFSRHRPNGFSVGQASYALREDVPAQDCDRLALPPDHQDRPADVAGIALDGINPVLAVPACRQAMAVFPNVRRFVTALGSALQKDGKVAEAIADYRLATEADDATAMALLGQMLRDGVGETVDPQRAGELFERARKADNGTALFAIGQSYEKGELGHARDLTEATKWYIRAAAHNSAEANARLGAMAQAGTLRGGPDLAQAYAYFQKAADLGLPLAMQRLAQMNEQGQTSGHVRDFRKAFEWYAKAAATGRSDSMLSLGNLYLEGLGVVADPVKAREWLGKAASAGDSNAMLQMGRLEFEGKGAPRDTAAAIAWFEKAAAAGRTESYARLGALFQAERPDGGKPDYAQAFVWDEKGAAINDAQSFCQLGMLYEGGLGRPVDYVKAEQNYQRAADLGKPRGFFQLGLMAERGRGRPVDFMRAVANFKRAADLSYAPAMVRLGVLTENGSGTQKDDTAALVSFTKALQLGDPEGFWYAAVLTDAGRGGPKNPDRVAAYLLQAFQLHETHTVAVLSGDMSAFSAETRIALQRQLQARGLLKTPPLDGTYDAATREAVIASAKVGTD